MDSVKETNDERESCRCSRTAAVDLGPLMMLPGRVLLAGCPKLP